jgi:hypothetical protein
MKQVMSPEWYHVVRTTHEARPKGRVPKGANRAICRKCGEPIRRAQSVRGH